MDSFTRIEFSINCALLSKAINKFAVYFTHEVEQEEFLELISNYTGSDELYNFLFDCVADSENKYRFAIDGKEYFTVGVPIPFYDFYFQWYNKRLKAICEKFNSSESVQVRCMFYLACKFLHSTMSFFVNRAVELNNSELVKWTSQLVSLSKDPLVWLLNQIEIMANLIKDKGDLKWLNSEFSNFLSEYYKDDLKIRSKILSSVIIPAGT